MTPEMVMDLAYKGMRMTMTLASPLLLVTLCVGLLVSLFQAATQINESTLSFIPKIVGVCLVLILAGPLLMEMLVDYTRSLFSSLPTLLG
ncbi:flagellar biosynthesis protein FliQ [Pseudomonas sp. SWI44]|uniref:flagellar biosynthesis protein FliQ n=1 Tax=Pseudomonas sp. SWI44 TaxID=2083053 RepID=UPI000CE5F7D2|nr:flagellar biosynthesis protein FliQ [Pseudomonas sp. SWI44]AVD88279.1 flagellar biosynthetic protein FliQ [Pseudomonas sp. SWI44]